jgi:RNA polymerase sigma-70 factor (ECF subfamily)
LAVRDLRANELDGEAFPHFDADDADLVLAAQRERSAFGPIYERYIDSIYRYCLRRCGHRQAAEDATATVFMKAMASIQHFRVDGRSFRSWLFAIAHNTLVDLERANRPTLSGDEIGFIADSDPGPEQLALASESNWETVRLLLALPTDQRRVLELRLAGLETREIAGVLGISDGAVRASQYRAAKRMRLLLKRNVQDGGIDGTH